jgi:hypothetical protein
VASEQATHRSRSSEPRFAVPTHVASRAFPTEMVLLNLNTGQYHGLNPTAGRMFEAVEEHGDLETAAARLAVEFEQPYDRVAEDLQELCSDLVQRGLLEASLN